LPDPLHDPSLKIQQPELSSVFGISINSLFDMIMHPLLVDGNEGESSLLKGQSMWRALFLSMGIFCILLGLQCLVVSQFTLKAREDAVVNTSLFESTLSPGPNKKFNPPAWFPWSSMACGAVICLYSFTIPKRVAGG
jgi:hypothetical protein